MTSTRARTVAVGAAVLTLTAGLAAYATAKVVEPDTISACVSAKTGAMRLETAKTPCVTDGPKRTRERRVTWNEQGLPGADGLAGTPGADGTSFRSGLGMPAAGLGADGDSYLNLETGNVHVKTDGTWTSTGSLRGRDGRDGADGPSVLFATGSGSGPGSDSMTDTDFVMGLSGPLSTVVTVGPSYTVDQLRTISTMVSEALPVRSMSFSVTPSFLANLPGGTVTFHVQLVSGPAGALVPVGPECTTTAPVASLAVGSPVTCHVDLGVTLAAGSFAATIVHTSFSAALGGTEVLDGVLHQSVHVG